MTKRDFATIPRDAGGFVRGLALQCATSGPPYLRNHGNVNHRSLEGIPPNPPCLAALHNLAGLFGTLIQAYLVVATLFHFASTAVAAPAVVILPDKIELASPAATHQLTVQRVDADGNFRDQVTAEVTWHSSDTTVAKIDISSDGFVVKPVGNGTATITATVGEEQATCAVTVRHFEQAAQFEFQRHLLPVLSKQGCNSGACHGALAGKGGFKLSLRGYDPSGDYFSITREARGRRIELSDPGRSLVLAKPSGVLPHKGGLRLDPKSPEYQVVAGWISSGASPPTDDDPDLLRVEVLPDAAILAQGDQQQLVVRAFYSDGCSEDVTRWAKYSSSNETVTQVDDQGRVEVVGRGEGAIVVWFSSRIVLSRVTSPFNTDVDEDAFVRAPQSNFIDQLSLAKLQKLGLQPSPRCDDATFIRRAFLDTIGTLPTVDEVVAFLDDDDPGKRDQLVEMLLTRKEFVDYWTYRWCDVFLVNGKRLRPDAVKAYYRWIRQHIHENNPWDQIVREVVTARGFSLDNGETNFYALHQSPEEMAENVSQAFLGLSIGCAKCHNHPLEKWTNDQYYAMANLFARVRVKGWGGDGRSGDGKRTLFVANTGELSQPLTGRPQPPAPLDAEPLSFDDTRDRREYLAEWITAADNPYFSRAVVNRIWANFLGIGLVEPIDDLRVSNPASNDELLTALTVHLVENNFDLKSLMRVILQSETYQRCSAPYGNNDQDTRFYARYYPRRLMAEVLLDAISQVTKVPTEFKQIGYDGADFEDTKDYPLGTRAIELFDSAVVSEFLSKFGRNNRDIVCECERSNKPSMVQVLHISNGDTINTKLKSESSCVATALDEDELGRIIERAYLSSLSRYPSASERDRLLAILDETPDEEKKVALEDLYWSLLSSREFLFTH